MIARARFYNSKKITEENIIVILAAAFDRGYRAVKLNPRSISFHPYIPIFGVKGDMKQFLYNYGFKEASIRDISHLDFTFIDLGIQLECPIEYMEIYYKKHWKQQIRNISKKVFLKHI